MQFPRLERLGWNDDVARTYETHLAAGLEPGRVSVQHRGAWEVVTEAGEQTSEITGRLRHDSGPGEHVLKVSAVNAIGEGAAASQCAAQPRGLRFVIGHGVTSARPSRACYLAIRLISQNVK